MEYTVSIYAENITSKTALKRRNAKPESKLTFQSIRMQHKTTSTNYKGKNTEQKKLSSCFLVQKRSYLSFIRSISLA